MKQAFILLMCLSVLRHVVSAANSDEWLPCSGGLFLSGLDEWDNNSMLRCCDPASGVCHGYNATALASSTRVVDSLQSLLNTQLPIQRKVFQGETDGPQQARSGGDSPSVEKAESPSSPCCRSKISHFYPVAGFSASTRKRVAVIQIGPFKQPVVLDQCLERGCRILRGNCTQVYSPQPLYILTTDEGGKLGAKLDFVLVEAGCQCQTRPLGQQQQQLGPVMGVDTTVRGALRLVTGVDFDEDYFAVLAAIDAASAIAGQPPTPVIDPQQLGNPTTTTTTSSSIQQMITSSLSSTSTTQSSHDLGDNEITSTTPPTTSTTSTTSTKILPLPELPDHGQPIAIPPGHFNPVLLSIQKFLKPSTTPST